MRVEVWEDPEDNSITCFPVEKAEVNRRLLSSQAKLLRVIEATDWNDAMRQHYELMGWEPYKPMEET